MKTSQISHTLEVMKTLVIEHKAVCSCGAVTLQFEGISNSYSMSRELFDKGFLGESLDCVQNYSNCNHCVNHWGIDLCACGSGESPDTCDDGFGECGHPMQELIVGDEGALDALQLQIQLGG